MKKHILSILSIVLTAVAANAQTTDYELKVNDFFELKVVDPVDVVYRYHPDSVGMATFRTDAAHASGILFQQSDKKLTIELSPEAPRTGLPVVTVYSTSLIKAENGGAGKLTVVRPQRVPKFKAKLIGNGRMQVEGVEAQSVEASIATGNGTLIVSGKCDIASLSNTGSGQLQADELQARQIKASMWGTGSIGCNPAESLSVTGAGSGKVYYLGQPAVKNRSLAVKALPLNAK
ncbi:MAG: DUF2807 domain-containing protein [Muribaculaceae bacterium]|nr:DUF2807 domain-containing protein [Muribaculaceae bacterium]